jgi:hypothetical protein
MTISLDDAIYQQLRTQVPAKQRSQFIESILAEALEKKRIADKDAEYAAKDPDFLAEQDFFMDFCGDVGHESW